jgi:hypothetical protein
MENSSRVLKIDLGNSPSRFDPIHFSSSPEGHR